ncbi:hypothetical protein [Billgrantia montanilacus]|uniref:Peptide ABC transporter substrate-binding protein n=1 Tax=Billgrantia montanilacus TaxID=2282305 RepID=A0A368TYF9_9GAMM|nr:hypothetical protein [Halomonas montanilacus]RCV89386.1 hypothetical protein DU505_10085 [Halomonas montanilacus]
MSIRESDWKAFKRLRAVALERFSQRVLGECQQICSKRDATAHERYGELYGLIHERDREMALAFDHFSRSSALSCLRIIRMHNLLTEAEVAEFSKETQCATSVVR